MVSDFDSVRCIRLSATKSIPSEGLDKTTLPCYTDGVPVDEANMTIQRIQDFINGELQVIAEELREEALELRYEEFVMEMYGADPRFYGPDYGADDCDGVWFWDDM